MDRSIFIVIFIHFVSVLEGISYDSIIRNMTQEDLIKTGLHKLNEEEKQSLDEWFGYHDPNYYLAIPKVEKSTDQKIFLKSDFRVPLDEPQGKNWELALVAVFQDETPYLGEFIEFHKQMGVEHFFLYDNLSKENFYDEIGEFIETGEVELFEWPVVNFVKGQCDCYTDAVYRCKGRAKWLIFADTDLFFFPIEKDNLVALLQEYDHPKIGGVTVNLLYFGTSGVEKLQEGESLIQQLTKCAGEVDHHIRCIVRPERVKQVNNPHFAQYYPQYFAVDENLSRNEGPFNERRPVQKIRANHYALRTLDFLKNVYGIRHVRFEAEKNGLPLPTTIPDEMWKKFLELDEKWSVSEDHQILRFSS